MTTGQARRAVATGSGTGVRAACCARNFESGDREAGWSETREAAGAGVREGLPALDAVGRRRRGAGQ
ncbi:MAG: hypothetical protein MZW92_50690 [Comamonadaceae bacterium]|nr:hypothetical protein [Comamonadaceae bacterium]